MSSPVDHNASHVANILETVAKSYSKAGERQQVGQSNGHKYVTLDSTGKVFAAENKSNKRLTLEQITELVKNTLEDLNNSQKTTMTAPERLLLNKRILESYSTITSEIDKRPASIWSRIFGGIFVTSKEDQVKEAKNLLDTKTAGYQAGKTAFESNMKIRLEDSWKAIEARNQFLTTLVEKKLIKQEDKDNLTFSSAYTFGNGKIKLNTLKGCAQLFQALKNEHRDPRSETSSNLHRAFKTFTTSLETTSGTKQGMIESEESYLKKLDDKFGF